MKQGVPPAKVLKGKIDTGLSTRLLQKKLAVGQRKTRSLRPSLSTNNLNTWRTSNVRSSSRMSATSSQRNEMSLKRKVMTRLPSRVGTAQKRPVNEPVERWFKT